MSIPTTLQGITYQIPETSERNWGATVTALLVALAANLDAIIAGGGGTPILQLLSADNTLSAGGTLTTTRNWHRIQGNGAAVTLSTGTAIANGAANGQLLLLTGTHATNTVTLNDAANTRLNGNITLGLYDALLLIWDSAIGDWIELARNQ